MSDPANPFYSGEVAAAGIALVWEIFKSVAGKATSKVTEKLDEQKEQLRLQQAANAYCQHLIRHYGTLRVLGSSEDSPLDDLFTDLYILKDLTTHRREQIEELHKADPDSFRSYSGQQERAPGIALIKSASTEHSLTNFYILGKPGAGKTTFLKYIAMQCARQRAINRLPIFVSLHEWARQEKKTLFDFIVSRFEVCKFPDADQFVETILQEGKAILLFDGLDEVRREGNQRDLLTDQLRDFVQKYDRNQHLITCRIAASDYIFHGFKTVEVADFTPEQIESYGRKWFHDNPEIGKQFIEELKKPDHKGVYELCNTPLLLSLVCFAFDHARAFPPTRAELYEDALDVLLRRWDTSRNIQRDAIHPDEKIYRELSPKRKKDMFARIAARTFEKGEYFFRRRDLERWIAGYLATLPNIKSADEVDGQIVLRAIEAQHSIFVERAKDIYSFSHLTFQEYFTALYAAQNQSHGSLSRLCKHMTERHWREVFLLTTSLLDDADGFVQEMLVAIGNLVADDTTLLALLTWAERRAKTAIGQDIARQPALCLAYIFLDLALSRDQAHDLDRGLALEIARALDHALARALARELERASDLDYDRAFARGLALEIARDRARMLALARALSPSVGIDYGLYYCWEYAELFAVEDWQRTDQEIQQAMYASPHLLTGVAELAAQADEAELAEKLTTLPILAATASAPSWQLQSERFLKLLRQRDLLHDWQFGRTKIDKLNDYVAANELLVQCLKVAVVSDRQGILAKLFAPPKAN